MRDTACPKRTSQAPLVFAGMGVIKMQPHKNRLGIHMAATVIHPKSLPPNSVVHLDTLKGKNCIVCILPLELMQWFGVQVRTFSEHKTFSCLPWDEPQGMLLWLIRCQCCPREKCNRA